MNINVEKKMINHYKSISRLSNVKIKDISCNEDSKKSFDLGQKFGYYLALCDAGLKEEADAITRKGDL